jgi:hypothetical protein
MPLSLSSILRSLLCNFLILRGAIGSFYEYQEGFDTLSDDLSTVYKYYWNFTQTLTLSQDDFILGSSSSTSLFPAGPAGLILQSKRRRLFENLTSQLSTTNTIKQIRVSLTRGIWRSDLWGSNRFRNLLRVAPTGMSVEIVYNEQSSSPLNNDARGDVELRESMEDAEAALSLLSCESVSRRGGSSASLLSGMQGGWSGGASGVRRESYYSRVCPSSYNTFESPLSNTSTNQMICAEFPSTSLCVESITSFLSLLPCRGSAGVASMIQKNMNSFFTAPFLSLALELNMNDDDNIISLTQSFFTVQNYNLFYSSESIDHNASYSACPAKKSSSFSSSSYPLKHDKRKDTSLNSYHLFAGRRASDLRLGVGSILYSIQLKPLSEPLHHPDMMNKSSVFTINIIETLPYMFIRTSNSLLAWVSKAEGDNSEDEGNNYKTLRLQMDSVNITHLERGKEREFPEVVKITVSLTTTLSTLLSSSTFIHISTRFSSSLLHSQEYPPDTHRGFDIPSAFVSMCYEDDSDNCVVEVSQPLVVEIPAPDFSMPYNAATLVSTVMAFTLGTFVNALARRPRH